MAAIISAAGIGATASYESAKTQRRSAKEVANIAAAAGDRASAAQREMFDLARGDQQPWMDVGREQGLYALRDIANGDMSGFYNSPDYEFARSEGEKSIQRMKSAGGNLNSGNTLKDLLRFNQGLASSNFGDFWNRRSALAGLGQTANQSMGTLGQATAGNLGQIGMASAANQGNAIMAGANARSSMYQGLANNIGQLAANYNRPGGATNTFNNNSGGDWGQNWGQNTGTADSGGFW